MFAPISRMAMQGVAWLMLMLPAYAQSCDNWPLWRAFGEGYIQADGRVLADESEQRYSTSEGQAYALFFTLVANDRTAFERILLWTRANLAAGDLGAHLPAWQWGKKPDGTWGVADQNSAADADVWLAYTLLEAGRLWHEPRYTAEGNLVLANIRIRLIREYPKAGSMLLPAQRSFDVGQGGTRLNPSYLPVQLLRAFSKADPSGPWRSVIENNLKLLKASSPKGFVPDWAVYVPGKGYLTDSASGAVGAHDAIRVYLWWGMLSRQDAVAAQLKNILYGMDRLIPGLEVTPPLNVDTQTGAVSGVSPPGFSAALLPYFSTMGNAGALKLQNDRLIAHTAPGGLIGQDLRYYDQVLALFGTGWMEHRFSFSPQGQLVVKWTSSCLVEK
jgi:endoglucanase